MQRIARLNRAEALQREVKLKLRLFVLASMLLIAANFAFAQQVRTIGAGLETCGKWTQDRGANTLEAKIGWSQASHWVSGYLSGVFLSLEFDPLKNTDGPAILGWLDNYCRAHPLDTISQASGKLAVELIRRSK